MTRIGCLLPSIRVCDGLLEAGDTSVLQGHCPSTVCRENTAHLQTAQSPPTYHQDIGCTEVGDLEMIFFLVLSCVFQILYGKHNFIYLYMCEWVWMGTCYTACVEVRRLFRVSCGHCFLPFFEKIFYFSLLCTCWLVHGLLGIFLFCFPSSQGALRLWICSTASSCVYVGSGDSTPVLMLAQQVLYPLFISPG